MNELSVACGASREAKVSKEVWAALQEDGIDELQITDLDLMFVEGKNRLEYVVIPSAGRTFLGFVRGNISYRGKQGRVEEKRTESV